MRTLRVLVVALLIAGGLAVLAPEATASAPAAPKVCQSLNSLNQKLQKALASARTGKADTAAAGVVSSSFRKGAKNSPGSLKSAMNTIAGVAGNVAHSSSTAEAVAALKNGGTKFATAIVKWGAYISKNCSG